MQDCNGNSIDVNGDVDAPDVFDIDVDVGDAALD